MNRIFFDGEHEGVNRDIVNEEGVAKSNEMILRHPLYIERYKLATDVEQLANRIK